MSYRMYLNKNDKIYPVPKPGDLFRVVAVYASTDNLLQPKVDVQLEKVSISGKPPEIDEKDK